MGRSLMYFFLANQKKAGVPECKPDDFFLLYIQQKTAPTQLWKEIDFNLKAMTTALSQKRKSLLLKRLNGKHYEKT